MNKELIFLEKSQAQRLRKDMCVFSGKQFNTKHIHSEVSKQWFGSEYYEHQEDVTYDSHIIKELDMYVFTFNFTKDAQKALTDKKREFEQNAATYRKEQIEKCREELRKIFAQVQDISDTQRNIAIEAIRQDHFRLSHDHDMTYIPKSELGKKVERLCDFLMLGDLHIIASPRYDPFSTRNHVISYKPNGLKCYKEYWPFLHFEGEKTLEVPYERFFESAMQNPMFQEHDYKGTCEEKYKEIMRDSLFTSHENRKGLQDLEEFVQNLTIEINASNYNPVDHL